MRSLRRLLAAVRPRPAELPTSWRFRRVWVRRELYTLRLPLAEVDLADGPLVLPGPHPPGGDAGGRTHRPLLGVHPFATVEADLVLGPGAGSGGIVWRSPDGSQRVVVSLDADGRLGAALEVDGAEVARTERTPAGTPTPEGTRLGVIVQLQGRSLLLWHRRGGTAAYVARLELGPHLDLRDADARAGWTLGLTLTAGGPDGGDGGDGGDEDARLTCSRFATALSGNGHADPRLVTYEDGTPLQEGGRVWFLATTRGSLIPDAYQGVYALDLATGALSMTGALFGERDGDGVWRNDNAGHLVLERSTGRWSWLAAGHSDHPGRRDLWTGSSSEDLRHGTHVLPVERVAMPDGSAHWEDVHPVRERDGWVAVASKDARRTSWLVSAGGLAGPWRETREPVGDDETGELLVRAGGRRFVVAGTTTPAFVVRDADDPGMPALGHLQLDTDTGGRRVWPALFRAQEADGGRWHLLSFDRSTPAGAYSYGALHLYRHE